MPIDATGVARREGGAGACKGASVCSVGAGHVLCASECLVPSRRTKGIR